MDECFDILFNAKDTLDKTVLNCSKDVIKAYATMHVRNGQTVVSHPLNDYDFERFDHFCEQMPPNLARYAKRLGQFADLAALRNQLTTIQTGTEIDSILLNQFEFKTHVDDNCAGKSEEFKKKYLLNMIDTILDGFLTAFNAMKDKGVEILEYLDKFDGVCVEAKSDNVQTWLDRSSGISKAARSTEKDNLAYSVTQEFNALADEVKAPFRAEARKACEAEVREACAKEGIVEEAEIEDRIAGKVEMILAKKDQEITQLVLQKIKVDGKFALYDNLAGANRPVTFISKNKETGAWKVTTLVDENDKPILKPVSAFDIDKEFETLVAMYEDDAFLMDAVESATVKTNAKVGNRNDLFATDVTDAAKAMLDDDQAVKQFCKRVKSQMRVKLDIPDGEFEEAVKQGLRDVNGLRMSNDEDTEKAFSLFIKNYADGSYADQLSDIGRLANLVARRVEYLKDFEQSKTAGLNAKSARCAQMLKAAFPDKVVDVKKAQEAIEQTLRFMIEKAKTSDSCRKNLGKLMYNGRLFTDELRYDISHRAAGPDEIALKNTFGTLLKCIEFYSKIERGTFFHAAGQEVKA